MALHIALERELDRPCWEENGKGLSRRSAADAEVLPGSHKLYGKRCIMAPKYALANQLDSSILRS